MDVLRRVYEALMPGGTILDLRSVPPPALVEVHVRRWASWTSRSSSQSLHNGEALADLAAKGCCSSRPRSRTRC